MRTAAAEHRLLSCCEILAAGSTQPVTCRVQLGRLRGWRWVDSGNGWVPMLGFVRMGMMDGVKISKPCEESAASVLFDCQWQALHIMTLHTFM